MAFRPCISKRSANDSLTSHQGKHPGLHCIQEKGIIMYLFYHAMENTIMYSQSE